MRADADAHASFAFDLALERVGARHAAAEGDRRHTHDQIIGRTGHDAAHRVQDVVAAVCPVNCFYTTADAVVLHSKDLCIGCGYCFYACPFGAPQYPKVGNFGSRGKMDKCTHCAGGPEADGSKAEYEKYGANRLAEGKLPLCAEMCSTKSLLAGDGDVIAQIYKE